MKALSGGRRAAARGLLFLALFGTGCSSAANADSAAAPAPVDVPLTVTEVAADGSMRFSIPIQIGASASFDVLFDTGSDGLVILDGLVPDSAFDSISTQKVDYVYGGGLQLSGVYAYGKVTIGGLTTPSAIPLMLVREVGCTASNPDCSGAGETPADATLFGPYRAILGAGMLTAGTFGNPIVQLPGHPSFIVKAPAYGGAMGTLRIGPTAQELSGFKTYPLPPYDGGSSSNGLPSWDDSNGLPGCVDDLTTGTAYCESAFLDSGACPSVIFRSGGPTAELKPGVALEVTIGPESAPLGQYGFTVGAVPTPGIDEVWLETSAAPQNHMNLGTAVYFRFNVLWDQMDGWIGLSAR